MDLPQASAALRRLAGPGLEFALVGAVRRVATETLVQNVIISPVGRPQAMRAGGGLRLRQDPHPGKLRSSWRVSINRPQFAKLPDASSYPVPGAAQAAAVFRGYRLGQGVFVTNDAKSDGARRGYADVVALVGRHVDRRGRTIGSLQAPEGTVLPAQRVVAQKAPALIMASITEAINRYGPRS
jgi:hypothetical protein